MVWRIIFAGLMGMALLGLGGCSETTRYKMVVEVDTPEGLQSGYAVREIRYTEPVNLPSIGESRPQWRVTGEAVAIDLPGGRTLFALLSSGHGDVDYAGRDIWFLFREFGSGWSNKSLELWPRVPRATSPRIADPLPMLVMFRDIDDPTSVERVKASDLEAVFGAGVQLRRIAVVQTDDAITSGMERRLPKEFWRRWGTEHKLQLAQAGGAMRNPYFQTMAGSLSRNDFTTRVLQ